MYLKLIHSRDVAFMEDYTIEDIDKVENRDPILKMKKWLIQTQLLLLLPLSLSKMFQLKIKVWI